MKYFVKVITAVAIVLAWLFLFYEIIGPWVFNRLIESAYMGAGTVVLFIALSITSFVFFSIFIALFIFWLFDIPIERK